MRDKFINTNVCNEKIVIPKIKRGGVGDDAGKIIRIAQRI